MFNIEWIFQGLVLALLLGNFSMLVLIFLLIQDYMTPYMSDEDDENLPTTVI
jgi:hypothetical protein